MNKLTDQISQRPCYQFTVAYTRCSFPARQLLTAFVLRSAAAVPEDQVTLQRILGNVFKYFTEPRQAAVTTKRLCASFAVVVIAVDVAVEGTSQGVFS